MGNSRQVHIRWIEGKAFEGTTESGHKVVTDASEAYGGHNSGPSPMELLLVALGNCTGISVADILVKKRQDLSGFELRVEGIDSEERPKVYTDISIVYVVKGRNISAKAVEDAIALSKEKYCGISAMLSATAKVTTSYEIVETGNE